MPKRGENIEIHKEDVNEGEVRIGDQDEYRRRLEELKEELKKLKKIKKQQKKINKLEEKRADVLSDIEKKRKSKRHKHH